MGCGASRIAAQIGESGYITPLSNKIKSCYSYQLDSRRDVNFDRELVYWKN